MSSAGPPEFFLDRSLGKTPASTLREAGHVVHLIADHYPSDATDIPDETWIAEGCLPSPSSALAAVRHYDDVQ